MPAATPRKNTRAAPPVTASGAPAQSAVVNRFVATYIMGIANRLSSGASSHYRGIWNIGMPDWRVLVALGENEDIMIRDVAFQADLDQAAASRSISLLKERGLVSVEQTRLRGRPAIVTLTPEGRQVVDQIKASARFRQKRLLSVLTKQEAATLLELLRKLETGVALMNEPKPAQNARR